MISLSGIDCAGKSTQIEKLKEALRANGRKCEVVWSRGGYTPGIESIKKIIRHGKTYTNEELTAHSIVVNQDPKKKKILLFASLVDLFLYYSIVLRIKGIGKTLICDRYIWDTYIDFKMKYPEYPFDKGFWWNITLKTMVKPKPSFVLFIPAEESMRRSTLKYEPFPEPIETREKRIQMYIDELKNNRWDYVIDATRSIEDVFLDIAEKSM